MSIRLYNTLTRRLDPLPEPPGPVRMYFCGPTVNARAHIGNARPFVVGMWLRNWLRERGYDATLVHNITDINDKIYEAAPGASARLAEQVTAWYLEDTGRLRPRDARPPAEGERDGAADRPLHRTADRGEYAYAVEGDVYFRVAKIQRTAGCPGSGPTRSRSRSRTRSRRIRGTSLSGRRTSRARTHRGTRPGVRRPGWHIECSVMAEELLGPVFEIHGGGSISSSRTTRTNWRSRARSATSSPGSGRTTDAAVHGREDVEVARQRRDRRGARPVGDGDPSDDVPRRSLAADGLLPGRRSNRRPPGRKASARSSGTLGAGPEGEWDRLVAALDDDFNTPEALAIMHGWRDHELVNARAGFSGSASSPRVRRAGRSCRPRPRRQQARADRDFGEADASAARSSPRAGSSATSTTASGSSRSDDRAGLRTQRSPRGAARPARVRELWATERALTAEPWLKETNGVRSGPPERELTEAIGSRDHQGVARGASRTAMRTPTSSAGTERALLVCLDQVTDPHNLGAVIRSAEGAGATGVVVPAHGAARVTPAVCRASAGAVEHLSVAVVPNLARYLNDVKGPTSGSGAQRRTATSGCGTPTSARECRVRPRARGEGPASACSSRATRSSRSRCSAG